MSYLNTVARKI